MNKKTLQVGLVGFGYAGSTFHAPVITNVANMSLAKVVQRNGASSKEKYPWVTVVGSVQELYADDDIDLVVITTPSTNHYALAKEAIMAGKHVVVEKPFTTTSSEADELISLAREKNVVVSVYQNRRWDGDFMTLRQVLDQSLLGRVIEAEFRWDRFSQVVNPGRWRDGDEQGSGTVYDLGVHFMDQALTLFGLPATITADIRIQREGGIADDYFDIGLGYADGLKVSLRSSLLIREPGPRYVVHGTEGSYVKYGVDPQERALRGGQTPGSPDWGAEPEEQWGKLHAVMGALELQGRVRTLPGAYQDFYQNISDHLLEGAELAVKPEEAGMAIRMIELAYQSHREGRMIEVGS